MQGVQQVPTGMIALRSVPVQMEESVNWMDLADALKGLLDPTAQSKVFISDATFNYRTSFICAQN